MKNPSKTKRKFDRIVGGALIADETKDINMPPEKSIIMNTKAMILNGEMSVELSDYTGIKENGKTKARLDNKYPRVLVSNKLDEKASIEAVEKYMQEKGIKSIKDIIMEQELEVKGISIAEDGTIIRREKASAMEIGD